MLDAIKAPARAPAGCALADRDRRAPRRWRHPRRFFVCGMGGSAIGGDLAAAALFDRLTKPMLVARGYELPSWAPPGSARALLELLGRHGGDARLLRRCRGGGRTAPGGDHRRRSWPSLRAAMLAFR